MVLSMLKINQISREKLFYGKYKFSASFNRLGVRFAAPGLYYPAAVYVGGFIEVYNLTDFKSNIDTAIKYRYSSGVLDSTTINSQNELYAFDDETIEKFINFKVKYFRLGYDKSNKMIIMSRSTDTVNVYANDITLIEELLRIEPSAIVHEVVSTFPKGIKYFKNNPPAKYRAHLKTVYYPVDTTELTEFFEKHIDIKISSRLRDYLRVASWSRRNCFWSQACFYFDYNDEATITHFGLLFSGLAGKIYKLEKHP